MKTTTAIVLLFLASSAAALHIPEGGDLAIRNSPLSRGEAAYVAESDGRARLLVGGADGRPMEVKDAATLHGYRFAWLPREEFAVVAPDSWTYDPARDRWTAPGVVATNTIYVQCKAGVEIESIAYDWLAEKPGELMPITVGNVTHVIRGNVAEIIAARYEAEGNMYVGNIRVCVVSAGVLDEVNDLTDLHVNIKDSLGSIELGNLRSWAKNLYNGNRGENWASYPATNHVRLAGKRIDFGNNSRYYMRTDSRTNLVVSAGGYDAITVGFHGVNVDTNSFRITSVTAPNSSGTVTLTYVIDVDDFSPSLMGVMRRDDLVDDVWHVMDPGTYTVSGDTVTIPGQTNPSGFYKLIYDGNVASNVLEVRLRGNVVVEDALVLKGTDGNYYKITVGAGGVISATQWSEP